MQGTRLLLLGTQYANLNIYALTPESPLASSRRAFFRSSFSLICLRHLMPFFMINSKTGAPSRYKNPRILKAHPAPTPSIRGEMAAVAAAPSKHLVKLLAAVAAPALPGYISVTSTIEELEKPIMPTPIRNSNTQGTAMLAWFCKTHPQANRTHVDNASSGRPISIRDCSMGKLDKSS